MMYQKKLWDDLLFRHCMTYEHGREAALLRMLTENELSEGVFVSPDAFNEEVVDVIYLKLNLETGILTIKAVQITISKWKNKRRKRSHKVWQERVLPRWLSENWKLEHQFIYVMPEKLNKEKLEKVEADLISYVAACHGEEDTNDEDDLGAEQCDGVDLAQVKSEPAEFKKLGDVHQCLAEFDKFLDLQEPAKLDKKNIKQCGGVVQEIGIRWACRRWSRTDAEVYYCCPAHNPNEIQLQSSSSS
ncbi:uncharacterized protein LOC9656447 [Selaginella moellendorffii]|uniref:uncharacterized protein LOC9656447 n=1 Tax=Selaginella moellendorffii TaxID=88036 RepID=UPI000D1C48E1|nr:uncharacterized protein LOC9656447 [Selaginella moellendorffii]|eukprot:XP_024538639.1 uncharacterized protein LOC9656447 [Selaginella moellendorffii]